MPNDGFGPFAWFVSFVAICPVFARLPTVSAAAQRFYSPVFYRSDACMQALKLRLLTIALK